MNLEEFKKRDPFRDEHVLYLHIDESHEHHEEISEEPDPKPAQQKLEQQPTHKPTHANQPAPIETIEEEEEKGVKAIFKDAGKQIVVSGIILVVGFLALNWSAYSKIIGNELKKVFGSDQESPLEVYVDDLEANIADSNNEDSERKVLRSDQPSEIPQSGISFSPSVEKKRALDIPDLNLEVAPIDNRIIIPRIDQNIPIVRVSSENLIKRDWAALENDIQNALQGGVVHYPGTSLPGQKGNVVITGHSSYFPWDPGRFKDVFALLHDIVLEDKLVVYYNQKKYIYEVTDIKVVLPEDIKVLEQTKDDQLTLITCTPVGTNLKRLIVIGKLMKTDDASPKIQRAPSEGINVDVFS